VGIAFGFGFYWNNQWNTAARRSECAIHLPINNYEIFVGCQLQTWQCRELLEVRSDTFKIVKPALRPTKPPTRCVKGSTRPEREAEYSPPPNAEDKKAQSYNFVPPNVKMWCLVRHRHKPVCISRRTRQIERQIKSGTIYCNVSFQYLCEHKTTHASQNTASTHVTKWSMI
jgi:hypothetical protein